jgi:hypothetical protein
MGGLMAITSFKIVSSPFKYMGILFGLITLVTLYTASFFIPIIGDGGTERWVAYPVVLWLTGLGSYLLGLTAEDKQTTVTANTIKQTIVHSFPILFLFHN